LAAFAFIVALVAVVFAFDATFAVDFFTAVFVLAADFFALVAVFVVVGFFLDVVAMSILSFVFLPRFSATSDSHRINGWDDQLSVYPLTIGCSDQKSPSSISGTKGTPWYHPACVDRNRRRL
jgi:hypothetical protein